MAETASCAAPRCPGNIAEWSPSRLIYRGEIVAMLFAIADMNASLEAILNLFREEFGGGEELPGEYS
jgi:hypothetical protein